MTGRWKIAGIVTGVVLLLVLVAWLATAPYPGNTGWQRTPGVIIGGTPPPTPSGFMPLNDVGVNLIMKLSGFPPFVVYLSYVGTPEGVITATLLDTAVGPE
jgi:hypothetical protein